MADLIKLPPKPESAKDWFGEFVGTGFGSGLGPIAPATWGSAAALIVHFLLGFDGDTVGFWVLLAITITIGIPAASILSRSGDEDPKRVVIDEWAGVYVTVVFLPNEWQWLLAGFFVFRVLDILKPWPASRLDAVHNGFGVVLDDIVAGIYGAIGLNVIYLLFFD